MSIVIPIMIYAFINIRIFVYVRASSRRIYNRALQLNINNIEIHYWVVVIDVCYYTWYIR